MTKRISWIFFLRRAALWNTPQRQTGMNSRKNTLFQDAIVRTIEIIGEAAAGVSEETKIAHAEIPWKEIVGMRNRLIHEYLDVDVQKVWQTVKEDIPKLIEKIQPLVPPETLSDSE